MSVEPVPPMQDLIADVMAAADPAAQRVAASRLQRMAASAPDESFAATMRQTSEADPTARGGAASAAGGAIEPGHAPVVKPAGGSSAVYRPALNARR